MSHPDLDALVAGELDAERASAARAHLEGCASCRREHDWLVAERRVIAARRGAAPAPLEALWSAVEHEIAGVTPMRERRRRTAAIATAGVALAAAAALVLVLRPRAGLVDPALVGAIERSDAPARPADVAPAAPATPPSEAEQAVADAERSYDRALDLLERDYRMRRAGLPGEVARSYDESFRLSRVELSEARASAGGDLDARVLVLDRYAQQVRRLQRAVRELK